MVTQGNPEGTLTPEEELEAEATKQGISVEELQAKMDEEKATEEAKALEERATAEGKTVEELKAEEEVAKAETTGILEKYGNDPVKLAQALKSSAQEATKLVDRQKLLEDEKTLLEQERLALRKPEEGAKDPRAKLITDLQVKYPNLDEEQIGAMVDMNQATIGQLRFAYAQDKAADRITVEKASLSSDALYKRYQKEIDEMVAKQPLELKLQPNIVQRVRNLIVGQHYEELIKEVTEKATKKGAEEKNILGEVTVGEPKPGKTVGEPKLTDEQEKRWLDMGGTEAMSKKDFLDIEKHKAALEKRLKDKSKK